MSTLSIKLKINGKEKTFVATEIKGRMLRKAMEFQKLKDLQDGDFDTEMLDNMVSFVCEVFGNKFTTDDVYDGLPIENVLPEVMRCINTVIERFTSKMDSLPNGQPVNQ